MVKSYVIIMGGIHKAYKVSVHNGVGIFSHLKNDTCSNMISLGKKRTISLWKFVNEKLKGNSSG